MTAAVLSDIHGNYHALKACYEDALRHGAEQFVFLGDYVSDLAEPRKTMDLVYEIMERFPTACLRGNRERYMLECQRGDSHFARGSKTGSLLFTYEQLTSRDLEFFRKIKISDVISIGGVAFEIAHAAKDDDRCYFERDDDSIFSQMQTSYLLTGHTHSQYVRIRDGKTVMNPGSVGIPQNGTRWPSYALIKVQDGDVSLDLRQVPYDMRLVINAQFESGLVDYSNCWGIGILYDIILGEECTVGLLANVCRNGDVRDEGLWRSEARKLGMKFTQQEILGFHEKMMRQMPLLEDRTWTG